jgi:hypothetical protein
MGKLFKGVFPLTSGDHSPWPWHHFFSNYLVNDIRQTIKLNFMTDQKNKQQQPSRPGENENDPHKTAKHPDSAKHPVRSDEDDERGMGSDPDPDKSIQIGDDPEQTKKKIPNMNK